MTKLDLLALYTKLSGFKLLVRANRAGATSQFARVVHDRLIDVLDMHAKTCSRAMEFRRLAEDTPWLRLAERRWAEYRDCLGDLEAGAEGFYPWHLMDHINRSPDFGGYQHPVFGVWCKGVIPVSMTVSDEYLDGLGPILRQIKAETGYHFTVYLCSTDIGPAGAGGIDPELYERPAGAGW